MTPTREEWRPVVGYEGLYEVSDWGNVRSLDRIAWRTTGPVRPLKGKALKPRISPQLGRRTVQLYRDGRLSQRTIYTLVLEAFVGPRPLGMEACHGDGDETNDRLDNLRWDTRSENRIDRLRHGRDHMANLTHCLRGHRFAGPNLRLKPSQNREDGVWRDCLACARARADARRARDRGLPSDIQAAADAYYAQITSEKEVKGV